MATVPELTLPIPPGYKQLVPFDKTVHRNLGRKTDQPFNFAASLNAVYLSAAEFTQAARHFPIVFANTKDGTEIVPMAVTGLKNGQNVFIDKNGSWPDGVYIPAYLRRYPFYTVQARNEGATEGHMICVDPDGLADNKKPFMDSDGNTSEEWAQIEKFIRDMELASTQTRQFTQTLSEYGLLETFEVKVAGRSGKEFRLSGMLKVSEEKLKELSCETLKALMKNNSLFLTQVHRMSLDNFRLLVDRAGTK